MERTVCGVLLPVATAAWFAYFTRKGWKGPASTGLLALVLGALAVPQAVVAFELLDGFGFPVTWDGLAFGAYDEALPMALTIGVVEETAKLLPITLIVMLRSGPTPPVHVLLWAALSGVGFAAAESALLFENGELGWRDALARAAAAPVTHALFAAPWGLGLGAYIVRRTYGPVVWGGAVSVLAHALYDLVLARREIPNFLSVSIVLALWIWLILRTEQPSRPARGMSLPRPVGSLRPGVLLRKHHLRDGVIARSPRLEW